MIIRNIRFLINKFRLLSIAAHFIDYCDHQIVCKSCKYDLLKSINSEISACHDEISYWTKNIVDFNEIAMRMVCTHSFDLLASGRYHVYIGTLDPGSCSRSLSHVHSEGIKWAINHGFCTEEDAKEDTEALRQSIKGIG